MRLSRRVALNDAELDAIHEAIVIRGVNTGIPHEGLEAVNRMGGWGQRITRQHWESMDVTVTFAIDVPKWNLELRRQIWEDVISWAIGGGWLTVNFMPDRRFFADHVILPSSGDLWAWTDDFTITFRAYSVPFWQDVDPTAIAGRGVSSFSGTLGVRGHFRTVADVTFKNTSGSTMTTFSITVGGRTIALTGISLANNADLVISHGTDGLLRVTAGGVSVYNKITAESADDLYVDPGTVNISMTAGKSGNVTVSVYGRYA